MSSDRVKRDDFPRLVECPVFIMTTGRSGSTLLRCILDTHSRIHAGHELHLPGIEARVNGNPTKIALDTLGLSQRELKFALWDFILHEELSRSAKEIIVEKTPQNLFAWREIAECWPSARYIFLYRHPMNVLDSFLRSANSTQTTEVIDPDTHNQKYRTTFINKLRNLAEAMAEAFDVVGGIKLRYEDLTKSPELVTQYICDFLNLPWESTMLNYGDVDHGPMKRYIGDWGEKIESGKITPDSDNYTHDNIPSDMRDLCKLFDYL